MSLDEISRAKRDAIRARARFEATLGTAQARLHPTSLAEEAWDGVKEKGVEVADNAVQAVKSRPATVSLTVGAVALFLARGPLKRAVAHLISGEEDEGIEPAEPELIPAKPRARKRAARGVD